MEGTDHQPASNDLEGQRHQFAERLRRHDDCTYVYTYPLKGAYRPLADYTSVIKAWCLASGPLNIYVHIPYCGMKCGFCNLFTTTQGTAEALEHYTRSVLDEARILARQIDWRQFEVDSLYFGGGTPTLLSCGELEYLIQGLRDLFTFRSSTEMAIESAPNSIDEKKLQDLRRLGFHRISFGVQSFQTVELQAMARPYDPRLAGRMAYGAIAAGFANVNVDLIFGLPNQSLQTWLQNLEASADLGVQTITIYPLTLRARTAFGKAFNTIPQLFPRGSELYEFYDAAVQFLGARGYQQRTSVAFALNGGGCRHEANEFAGIPTLGLGVAALSYAPAVHYTSGHYFEPEATSRVIGDYLRAIDERVLPIRSTFLLDRDETQRRHMIFGLLSAVTVHAPMLVDFGGGAGWALAGAAGGSEPQSLSS